MHRPPAPSNDDWLALPPDRAGLTIKRVAAHLGCDYSQVYAAVQAGELSGYRIGRRGIRIYLWSVEAYQRAREFGPTGGTTPITARPRRDAAQRAAIASLRAMGVL